MFVFDFVNGSKKWDNRFSGTVNLHKSIEINMTVDIKIYLFYCIIYWEGLYRLNDRLTKEYCPLQVAFLVFYHYYFYHCCFRIGFTIFYMRMHLVVGDNDQYHWQFHLYELLSTIVYILMYYCVMYERDIV